MKYIFVLNATTVGWGGGQGLYDKNIEVLYILNVTISIMLLYLLLDNLKNDDSVVGFTNIVFSECIINITLLCRKFSCHIMEATRFDVINSFARFGVCCCVLMLTQLKSQVHLWPKVGLMISES